MGGVGPWRSCPSRNVDQVSFVVMRKLGISDAFTNDRHFQAAGCMVLF
jgi:predicted nucleic acid-binding protein